MGNIFTQATRVGFIGPEANTVRADIMDYGSQIRPMDYMDEEAIFFVVDSALIQDRILINPILKMLRSGKRLLIIGEINDICWSTLSGSNVNFKTFAQHQELKMAISQTLNILLAKDLNRPVNILSLVNPKDSNASGDHKVIYHVQRSRGTHAQPYILNIIVRETQYKAIKVLGENDNIDAIITHESHPEHTNTDSLPIVELVSHISSRAVYLPLIVIPKGREYDTVATLNKNNLDRYSIVPNFNSAMHETIDYLRKQ